MPTILALDEGTTGATALVLGRDGRILGRGYREIAQFFPRPGEVEHDPMQLLPKVLDLFKARGYDVVTLTDLAKMGPPVNEPLTLGIRGLGN